LCVPGAMRGWPPLKIPATSAPRRNPDNIVNIHYVRSSQRRRWLSTALGESRAGRWSGGGTLSRSGRPNKWALPKFNSGNVRRPAMLNVENNDDRARVLSPQTDGRSTEGRFETLLGYRRGFDLVALRSSRPLISPTPVLGRLRSPPLPLDNAFQPGSLWD